MVALAAGVASVVVVVVVAVAAVAIRLVVVVVFGAGVAPEQPESLTAPATRTNPLLIGSS